VRAVRSASEGGGGNFMNWRDRRSRCVKDRFDRDGNRTLLRAADAQVVVSQSRSQHVRKLSRPAAQLHLSASSMLAPSTNKSQQRARTGYLTASLMRQKPQIHRSDTGAPSRPWIRCREPLSRRDSKKLEVSIVVATGSNVTSSWPSITHPSVQRREGPQ